MEHIDYRYLRPKKAEALEKWYGEPLSRVETPEIWQGRSVVLLPLRPEPGLLFGRGGVVDETGSYVALSAIPRRVEGAYAYEKPAYVDQKVVYCGYLVNQWGHFLVEGVARLWYFLENDPTIDKYVFLLNQGQPREIKGNYREFFRLLGILDKLEFISEPTAYREVVIPQRAFQCRQDWSPKFLDIFDTVAANAASDPGWDAPEKIFFSRSQLQKGSGFEFGLEILDDFFARNGYTILYPEKVPLERMIFYIRNAKAVATFSGSLPHNMLFAKNGQRVEIVERCVLNNDFQVCVNKMRELNAVYIDANLPLYPVDMCGPFLMTDNDILERFAEDQGYVSPDARFRSRKYLKKCFRDYMASYQDMYRYQWFMDDWYMDHVDYLWEGYQAGRRQFGEYLSGKRPFRWHHYLEFHYWKQFIKRLLGRE